MKTIKLLIGIALVLMLCISPVGAVSGSDFEDVFEVVDGVDTYKYLNLNDPDEKYTKIRCYGTKFLYSHVTFRPHNIPDSPKMLVYTYKGSRNIFLPQSVDEWEIDYYSRPFHEPNIYVKYLKNAGVINLNEYFRNCISMEFELELSIGQTIIGKGPRNSSYSWDIPSV